MPKSTKEFVETMSAHLEKGQFRAVIDRRCPLEQIGDAYRYVETGQKTGIVVVDVGSQPNVAEPNKSERQNEGHVQERR